VVTPIENTCPSATHVPDVFVSPDLFPLKIDYRRRVVTFVRMSCDLYRDSVFLDGRTRHDGPDVYEIRLDDLFLLQEQIPVEHTRVHYILHTAFCCSTLLARYFELLPECLVLKEPRLLTQMALGSYRHHPEWTSSFELTLRLLGRSYHSQRLVVIKVNDWCNGIGGPLLSANRLATATFLMMPLRQFIFAVLKSGLRREWVRTRVKTAAQDAAAWPALPRVTLEDLSDAQAAAYLWMVNGFLATQLSTGMHAARVLVLDGGRIADAPGTTLPAIAKLCGLPLDDEQLERLLADPSVRSYSKDLSKSYDASTRRQEMADLEARLGKDADAAQRWVMSQPTVPAWVSEADALWAKAACTTL
jgi:hypothetical protein